MYKLFLDDIRDPRWVLQYIEYNLWQNYTNNDEWIVVRSHDEFVQMITDKYSKGEFPSLISFDHDLSDVHYDGIFEGDGVEKTGYESAKWLVNFCMDNNIKLPEYLVHSQNTVGKENIYGYLNNFKKYQEKGG